MYLSTRMATKICQCVRCFQVKKPDLLKMFKVGNFNLKHPEFKHVKLKHSPEGQHGDWSVGFVAGRRAHRSAPEVVGEEVA